MRYSGVFAGIAFALSFLIGIISRSSMPMLIIRPLIFAVLFFAITTLGSVLISRFLPELMEGGIPDEDDLSPGSKVNILEDDGQPDSPETPELFVAMSSSDEASAGAKPDDSDDDLGDISELSERSAVYAVAGGSVPGIDLDAKEGYTEKGESSGSIVPDFSNMFGTESHFEVPADGQERAAGAAAKAGVDAGAKSTSARNVGAKTRGGSNSDDSLPDLDSMAGAFMSAPSDEGTEDSGFSVSALSAKPSSSKKAPEWTGDFNAKEIAMGLRSVLNKEKEG